LSGDSVDAVRDITLTEIRARLLTGYLKAVAVLVGAGILLMVVIALPHFTVSNLIGLGFCLVLVVLGWGNVTQTTRAWGFVLAATAFMDAVLFIEGFGVGSIAAGCTVPVTTYLLVGARAGLTAAGLWVLAVIALGLASTLGGFRPSGTEAQLAATLSHYPEVAIISLLTVGPVLIVARGVISNLERTIRAKTRLVEQLKDAQETLAQSERFRTLGVLAGGIAHDINNTLTVIMGETEILDIPQESRRAILDASEGAAQMTRQLLQSAGASLVQPQPIQLPADLESTLRSVRRVLPANIEFVEKLPPENHIVMADRVVLQQAILNLVFNARDAMPSGGTLTLCIMVEPRNGKDWLTIELIDTGTGMDDAILARAAEPLFTTKPIGKGSGLGLSNVKSTLEALGGTFELQSQAGVGTRARLGLPLVENNVHRLVPTSGIEKIRLRLLVVEDNPRLKALMAQTLTQHGHSVEVCGTYADATSILEKGTFQGLVSDIALPDGSGVQLARRFRSLRPEGRVLLVSGYSPNAADRASILENEFRLLRKPFRMSDLGAALLDAQALESVG